MGRVSTIAYDLTKSPYHVTIDGLTFYFSSAFLLSKFTERLEMSRDLLKYSLSNRFKLDVDVRQLADVTLYGKTESRGFRIVTAQGEEISCLSQAKFAGGKVMQNN